MTPIVRTTNRNTSELSDPTSIKLSCWINIKIIKIQVLSQVVTERPPVVVSLQLQCNTLVSTDRKKVWPLVPFPIFWKIMLSIWGHQEHQEIFFSEKLPRYIPRNCNLAYFLMHLLAHPIAFLPMLLWITNYKLKSRISEFPRQIFGRSFMIYHASQGKKLLLKLACPLLFYHWNMPVSVLTK